MKVTVTYNDKSVQVNLTDEQLETLGLKEKKKSTGYERVNSTGDCYWYKDSCQREPSSEHHRSGFDDKRYEEANYYSDEKIAQNNLRADTLMRRLRRFAAENGGIPSAEDWKNASMKKWFIDAYYNDVAGSVHIEIGDLYSTRDTFQIYFKSEEACEKAIEEFKDELTWYFTEYQAMLY